MFFLCIKVIFKRNGSFSSQHIHDCEAMKERGIKCVLEQDADQRMTHDKMPRGCADCYLRNQTRINNNKNKEK